MNRFIGVVIALAISQLSCVFVNSATLSSTIEACKRADAECLTRSVQGAFRSMRNGIPKLGVLPIDPLQITQMFIDQGTGPVNIKLDFKNQELAGLSDAMITRTQGNFTDTSYRLEIDSVITELVLSGDYTISGKILVLPIQGNGKNVIKLDECHAKMLMVGQIIKINGEEFVELEKLILTMPKLKRLRTNLTNLFNGDKALGDNMNKFLNDNWSIIWDEVRPSIEAAVGEVFHQVALRVYNKVPYNTIHLV